MSWIFKKRHQHDWQFQNASFGGWAAIATCRMCGETDLWF